MLSAHRVCVLWKSSYSMCFILASNSKTIYDGKYLPIYGKYDGKYFMMVSAYVASIKHAILINIASCFHAGGIGLPYKYHLDNDGIELCTTWIYIIDRLGQL